MKDDAFDPDALIDAMAPFLGLPIEEAYRPGIAGHLAAAHGIVQEVLAFATDDEAEPAPVFRA
ncbi:MAG: DUF4089 domain-containing protein [Oricola sp.]